MSNLDLHVELAKEEDVLCHEISDAALEHAATIGRQNAGAVTLSFCTGLDTCPA